MKTPKQELSPEEQIRVRKMVKDNAGDVFSTYDEYTPEQAIERIREYAENAKKEGLTDIKIGLEKYNYAYDSNDYYAVRVIGTRPENDKEYEYRTTRELRQLAGRTRATEIEFLERKKQFQPGTYTDEDGERLRSLRKEQDEARDEDRRLGVYY